MVILGCSARLFRICLNFGKKLKGVQQFCQAASKSYILYLWKQFVSLREQGRRARTSK